MVDTNPVAKNLSNVNKEAVHPRAPRITMACPFSSSCHNNEQQAGLRRQPVLLLTLYQPMTVFAIMVFHKPIRIYMGGLMYMLFSFFQLVVMVGEKVMVPAHGTGVNGQAPLNLALG